jgi:hypothetical protein
MNGDIDWTAFATTAEPTAADHYAGWSEVAYYGMWPDGEPVDQNEATANMIGWASRE